MKKIVRFVGLFLLFSLPIVAFYTAKALWMMADGRYQKTLPGNEIYRAMDKSKKKTNYRKLILGDSTANQLYNCKEADPDSAYSLTCNQAIGLVGQYALLTNYLEAGNRPDTVYLVYCPLSFWDNLDQVYTYHYFLKPFYTDEYRSLMDSTVMQQIHKVPKYYLSHVPYILTTTWAPDIPVSKRNYSFLSPVSRDYLARIDALGETYGFHLQMVPTILAEHWRDSVGHFDQHEFLSTRYAQKMKDYYQSISYLPDSCFSDEVHLKHPNLYRERIDRQIGVRPHQAVEES